MKKVVNKEKSHTTIETGKELSISRERVRQLEKTILEGLNSTVPKKLKDYLE